MGYVDPGLLGIISQIGFVLLFAEVSAFMFFLDPLKKVLCRLVRRNPPESGDSA